MHRSRRILAVCHCLLNANAKVPPLATYAAIAPALRAGIDSGAGLVQLPCPEVVHLGLRRWGMTREQYDVPAFRRACRSMLQPSVDQLWSYHAAGYALLGIVGVDGSPNCGVRFTCAGFLGGELCGPGADVGSQCRTLEKAPGRGVFMQELAVMLADCGLDVPLCSVDEEAPTAIVGLAGGFK